MFFLLIDDFQKAPICGGSLITNQHVLTAAHCVPGQNLPDRYKKLFDFLLDYPWYLRVSLGAHNWNDPTRPQKFVTLAKITLHPYDYDVAIFTLSEKIQFNQRISPICLPAAKKDYAGMSAIATGWGINMDGYNNSLRQHGNVSQPEVLMDATVNIISNEDCEQKAREHKEEVYPHELCTLEHGTTCQGDSGGPMFLEEYDDRSTLGKFSKI